LEAIVSTLLLCIWLAVANPAFVRNTMSADDYQGRPVHMRRPTVVPSGRYRYFPSLDLAIEYYRVNGSTPDREQIRRYILKFGKVQNGVFEIRADVMP
jgi:hypothetical protein